MPKIDVPGVSLYWEEKRGRYRLQFTRNGRRKRITISKTSPGAAYKEALDYAERYDAGRYDPFSDQTRHTNRDLTVGESINEYLKTISQLSGYTVTHRTWILNSFNESLPTWKLLRTLTATELRTFFEAPRLRPASQRSYYNQLNTWLNWCVEQSYLDTNPLEDVTRPRIPEGPPRYFTVDEYRRLIKYVRKEVARQNAQGGFISKNKIEDYLDIIPFAVETGLRRGELLHIRWMDIDFRSGLIHVRAYKDDQRAVVFKPKYGKNRTVPLSPTASTLLKNRKKKLAIKDETEAVFALHGKPRTSARVSKTISRFIGDAGLDPTLHLHSLRHTFASWLASSGVPLATIQKWMGHRSITQTQVYANLLPSALRWQGSNFHEAATRDDDEPSSDS